MPKYISDSSIQELLKKSIETLAQSKDINAVIKSSNFVTEEALRTVLKNIQNGYALKSEIPAITTVHGESAYEEAVKLGKFTGTEEEYIASLKGEKGDRGEIGPEGKSAYDLAKELKGFEGTPEEYLASLKGEKGDSLPQQSLCDALKPYAPKGATDAVIFKLANKAIDLLLHKPEDERAAAITELLNNENFTCTHDELMTILAKYPTQTAIMSNHLALIDTVAAQDKRINDNKVNMLALNNVVNDARTTVTTNVEDIKKLQNEKDAVKNRLDVLEDPAKQVTIIARMFERAVKLGFPKDQKGLVSFANFLYAEMRGQDCYEAAKSKGFTGTVDEWKAIVSQDATLKILTGITVNRLKEKFSTGFQNAASNSFDVSKPDTWITILASYIVAQDNYKDFKVDEAETDDFLALAKNAGFTGDQDRLNELIQRDILIAYLSAYVIYLQNEVNKHSEVLEHIAKGVQGPAGKDGAPGKSSYELYKESLGEGETPLSQQEWLDKMQGAAAAQPDFYEIKKEDVEAIFKEVENNNPSTVYTDDEIMTDDDINAIINS